MTQPAPTPAPPGDPAQVPPTPTPPGDPPEERPLGPGGEKALAAEREARKGLEKQLAELAPLKKLAEMLGAGTPAANGKNEVDLLNERFGQYEKDLTEERQARWRAEVAAAKGLSVEQAERLRGTSREEFAADADKLVALFPPAQPGTPRPDPSQGARGTPGSADLESQIAEAQKAGDIRKVIALQRQKLQTTK